MIIADAPVGRVALIGVPWLDDGDEFRPEITIHDRGDHARLVTEPHGHEIDLTPDGVDELIAALSAVRARVGARVEADTAQLLLECEGLR